MYRTCRRRLELRGSHVLRALLHRNRAASFELDLLLIQVFPLRSRRRYRRCRLHFLLRLVMFLMLGGQVCHNYSMWFGSVRLFLIQLRQSRRKLLYCTQGLGHWFQLIDQRACRAQSVFIYLFSFSCPSRFPCKAGTPFRSIAHAHRVGSFACWLAPLLYYDFIVLEQEGFIPRALSTSL